MEASMNRLREARFWADKPQARLWYETNIHYSTLSRIERGYQKPTEAQKEALAKALGVKVSWLFPDEVSTENTQQPTFSERKKRHY